MLNRFVQAICLALAPCSLASGGFMLTAEVYDTPGLPGYQTYDLTATTSNGYLNAFDFYDSGRGITGSLYHGGAGAFPIDPLFAGATGQLADTHWLVGRSTGLSLGADQSAGSLNAAYTFTGDSGQRDTHRSLPFARIVTDDPASVRVDGEFLVTPVHEAAFYSINGRAYTEAVDLTLTDIQVGPAPAVSDFGDLFHDEIVEQRRLHNEALRSEREADLLLRQQEFERRQAEILEAIRQEQLAAEVSGSESNTDPAEPEPDNSLPSLTLGTARPDRVTTIDDALTSVSVQDPAIERPIYEIGLGADNWRVFDTTRLETPSGGLQSAMTTALLGLQAAETTIRPVGIEGTTFRLNRVGFQPSPVVYTLDLTSLDLTRTLSYTDIRLAKPFVLDSQTVAIPEPSALGLLMILVIGGGGRVRCADHR